ncbi:hypothetical protein F5Y18DRAFT_29953 [Xylariaceae sp. FL1019]|nr:hypothetical protein F5Y18DRAFT_29953 [Xylariaceae sp. FL1019]
MPPLKRTIYVDDEDENAAPKAKRVRSDMELSLTDGEINRMCLRAFFKETVVPTTTIDKALVAFGGNMANAWRSLNLQYPASYQESRRTTSTHIDANAPAPLDPAKCPARDEDTGDSDTGDSDTCDSHNVVENSDDMAEDDNDTALPKAYAQAAREGRLHHFSNLPTHVARRIIEQILKVRVGSDDDYIVWWPEDRRPIHRQPMNPGWFHISISKACEAKVIAALHDYLVYDRRIRIKSQCKPRASMFRLLAK